MKLEILKKLVALANNNPNDHEANTAARRVCKALIEDKFIEQLSDTKQPKKPSTTGSTINTQQAYEDLLKYAQNMRGSYGSSRDYYTEYRRRTGQPPNQYYYNPWEDSYTNNDETERRIVNERSRSWREEYFDTSVRGWRNPRMNRAFVNSFFEHWQAVYKAPHPDEHKANKTKERNTGKPEGFFWDTKEQKWKEGRELKCKTCGKITGTIYKGAAELFECNDCQWSEWYRKKQDKEQQKRGAGVCGLSGKSCPTPVTCVVSGCQFKF